jgi:hypothetical protein
MIHWHVQFVQMSVNKRFLVSFLGFHSSVIDDTGCLGCDAVLLGDWFTVVLKTVFLLGFKAHVFFHIRAMFC